MKGFRILGRSLRDSLKSIFRNFSLSLAAILCVTITLILVSVSILASSNINYTTQNIESELNIIVYLKEEIDEDTINLTKADFEKISEVESVIFKSNEEWKNELTEYDETLGTILNYLDENPLLNSFTVKVKDANDLSEVAEYIESNDNVDSVKYGEGMIESVISTFSVVQNITIAIVVALVLVTAFLIGNTIKLTIFSRRNEIEIMRLVGASNTAIKLPFIFEGLFVGIIGSIIPISITIYGYIIMYSHFEGILFSDMIKLIDPYFFVFEVSAILLSIGAIVGVIGSLRAVRKYLKI